MKIGSFKDIGKKKIILGALILALGSAVFLNWQLSSEKGLINTNTLTEIKELGEAQFVNNTPEEEKPQGEQQSANEYFVKTKNSRKKARDEATEMLKEILEDAKSSQESKTEAIKHATEIAKIIEKEANIESLVKAKGFTDCVAFIQNDECSVVVSGGELDDSKALAIKDIVAGQGAIAPEKIKITQAK